MHVIDFLQIRTMMLIISNAWMKGHRWFRVYTIGKELNELKYNIERKLQHSYVERFVKKAFIDEDKLEILHYIYQDIQIPIHIRQQHMMTIMLVQIALDTHEEIPNEHTEQVMNETEKQLSVLAGDYYSGLYYLLLSEIEEVNMIQVLASAIRKMNESKMTLIYENYHSTQELLEIICQIESTLYIDVATYLGKDPYFIAIIQDILLINRLKREQQTLKGVVSSYFSNQVTKLNTYDDIVDEIDKLIQSKKEQLEVNLMQLPYQYNQFKNMMIDKYSLSYTTSFVEEG